MRDLYARNVANRKHISIHFLVSKTSPTLDRKSLDLVTSGKFIEPVKAQLMTDTYRKEPGSSVTLGNSHLEELTYMVA